MEKGGICCGRKFSNEPFSIYGYQINISTGERKQFVRRMRNAFEIEWIIRSSVKRALINISQIQALKTAILLCIFNLKRIHFLPIAFVCRVNFDLEGISFGIKRCKLKN